MLTLSPISPAAGAEALSLSVNVVDTGSYGYLFGTNANRTLVVATFTGDGLSTYTLQVTGHDIDKSDEVSVHVNGALIGYLSRSPNDANNDGDTFELSPGVAVQGTNTIEFREKVDGWKWGVTNIGVLGPSAAGLTLEVDVVDTGSYGYGFGTNENETSLSATFIGDGETTYSLQVVGYDIDQSDEVSVHVNDTQVGYLSKGANNGFNGGDIFALTPTVTVPGENVIEFRQKNKGWVWGVTNIGVFGPDTRTDMALNPDVVDAGSYGYGFGTNANPLSVTASFLGDGSSTYYLQVTGYDIDSSDEVSVLVNSTLVGHLTPGPSNALNAGDVFVLAGAPLLAGDNVIEFRQKTEGYVWGVTGIGMLTIDPTGAGNATDITLTLDTVNEGSYGYLFGTNANETSLTAAYKTTSTATRYLTVKGYDIDTKDEVSVHVNGTRVGYLATGPNNGMNAGDVFTLGSDVLQSGDNVIEFRQGTPGWKWGVTGIGVLSSDPGGGTAPASADISLVVDQVDPGSYGKGFGTNANEASLSASFTGDGSTTYYLQVTGYDVDTSDEVSVWINGASIGTLSSGPNNGLNGGDVFALPAGLSRSGSNLIEFRQKTPGWVWGVTAIGVMSSAPTTEPPPPPPSGEFADLQFRSITGPSVVSGYVDGATSDLFTFTIFNAGPASANVNVFVTLSGGDRFIQTCQIGGPTRLCPIGIIPAGKSGSVTGRILFGSTGTHAIQATATFGSPEVPPGPTDPNTANNSGTFSFTVKK